MNHKMEFMIDSNESAERRISQNISRLSENLDNLNIELNEMRFRLEKAHCDLVLTIDPSIMRRLENTIDKCESCAKN
jgi:uncharacterized protein Yka (UPF0111/DUF47 family)